MRITGCYLFKIELFRFQVVANKRSEVLIKKHIKDAYSEQILSDFSI